MFRNKYEICIWFLANKLKYCHFQKILTQNLQVRLSNFKMQYDLQKGPYLANVKFPDPNVYIGQNFTFWLYSMSDDQL